MGCITVVELRHDLEGGLDLIPEERRDQWAAWIDEAETKPISTFTPRSPPGQHLQHALHNAARIGHDTDTVALRVRRARAPRRTPPIDEGVLLGAENTAEHDATAIVSLFRRGRLDVPFRGTEPAVPAASDSERHGQER